MQLTQKETELLKDLREHELLCIDKYDRGAKSACDGCLKQLFSHISSVERQHLTTIEQIQNGQTPSTSGGGQSAPPQCAAVYGAGEDENKKNDAYLCADALASEKNVSHMYDTCIFEFSQTPVRSALNHIQKEEQEHGKLIYDYMKANSMYG